MKQKKIGNKLYVFSEEPYIITEDTDVDIIYIQEDVINRFARINLSLISKMRPINYHLVCVRKPEWAEYYNYNFELDYLTIKSLSDDNVIKWRQSEEDESISFDIQYSTNKIDWMTVTSTSEGQTITTLNKNEIIYIKGNYQPYVEEGYVTFCNFVTSGEFKVYGNIMSLSNGDDYKNAKTIENDFQFYYLFGRCRSLKDASDLILPATTLTEGCYGYMFAFCTSLTTAPELPATILTERCYISMFSGCTSLTIAPELPATTLAEYCYYWMFNGCTSLTSAPELPATTLTQVCYYGMFENCSSLTTAPVLPATTLVSNCYRLMFHNCTSLNSITMLATLITGLGPLSKWVNNVAATGTFTKSASMTTLPTGDSGIPSGWTVVDA